MNPSPDATDGRDSRPRLAVAVMCGVLILGACAGGGDDDDVASSNADSTPATEAPTTEGAATTVPPETTSELTPTTEACLEGNVRGVALEDRVVCKNGQWVAYTTTTRAPTTTAKPTTTLPPTATLPETDGSREHPFDLRANAPGGPDILSSTLLDTFVIIGLQPGDWNAIYAANQFNTEPPAGKHYVKLTYVASVKRSVTEPVTYFDVACDLVGRKGRIYEQEFLSDTDGNLALLSDQPDVIGGGSMGGDVYYIVDDDDRRFRVLCDDTYIIPG